MMQKTYDIASDMVQKTYDIAGQDRCHIQWEHATSQVMTYDIVVTYDTVNPRYRRTYDVVHHDIVGHDLQCRTCDIVGL
jgi:hypothetical protein